MKVEYKPHAHTRASGNGKYTNLSHVSISAT